MLIRVCQLTLTPLTGMQLNRSCLILIKMLQFELRATCPAKKLQNDDEQVHFYAGLSSCAVFGALLDLLVGVMSKHLSHGLSINDQFLLVLMKLRLGIPIQDLAYRFGISQSRVSQLFHE